MRYRLVFLVGAAALGIAAALATVTRTTTAQPPQEERPFARLRALSTSARKGLDRRGAREVGFELAPARSPPLPITQPDPGYEGEAAPR
jgi:hypothetical protein